MSSTFDCYSYPSYYGEVLIIRNEEHPSRWDLRIGGKLICPDYYSSPEEAASCANKRDFGDEELNGKYIGLRVPYDLDTWKAENISNVRR